MKKKHLNVLTGAIVALFTALLLGLGLSAPAEAVNGSTVCNPNTSHANEQPVYITTTSASHRWLYNGQCAGNVANVTAQIGMTLKVWKAGQSVYALGQSIVVWIPTSGTWYADAWRS